VPATAGDPQSDRSHREVRQNSAESEVDRPLQIQLHLTGDLYPVAG